ncbi:MAG: hypothetical protein J6W21_09305, partial [Bacteroidaceae bacterium]|nr:hypothetical protein [Bacteroidaceae bacterium]
TSDNREGWWCATDFVLKYHAIDSEDSLNEELRVKSEESDNAVYDLSGRYLSKPQKGVNIVNGKKMVRP